MPRRQSNRPNSITYKKSLLGYELVTFTRHALVRMKQRKIAKDDVYRTIEEPDETGLGTDYPYRKHVARQRPTTKFAIHVVYELHPRAIRVITTYEVDMYVDKGSAPLILRIRKKPPGSNRKPRKRGRKR